MRFLIISQGEGGEMKLYWKHIWWNYTVRLWYLWKYRNSKWKAIHCMKLVQTSKEMDECCRRIDEYVAEILNKLEDNE